MVSSSVCHSLSLMFFEGYSDTFDSCYTDTMMYYDIDNNKDSKGNGINKHSLLICWIKLEENLAMFKYHSSSSFLLTCYPSHT